MNVQAVDTQKDFVAVTTQFLLNTPPETSRPYTGYMVSLEHYLRSLWAISRVHRHERLTWSLFAQLLQGALTMPPVPVDPLWNRHRRPNLAARRPDFEHLRAVIVYQIADLHYINELRATGDVRAIRQTEGHIERHWTNRSVLSYLNTSIGYFDNSRTPVFPCRWHTMAVFLQVGQRYE